MLPQIVTSKGNGCVLCIQFLNIVDSFNATVLEIASGDINTIAYVSV